MAAADDIVITIETDADLHGPVADAVLAGLIAYNTAALPPSTGRFAVLARDLASGGLRAGISVALTGQYADSAWGAWSDDTGLGDAILPRLIARAEVEAARRGARRFSRQVRPGAPMLPPEAGWEVVARAEGHEVGLDYTIVVKAVADGPIAPPPGGMGIEVVEPPSRPLGLELWRRGDAYRQRRLGVPVRWCSGVARKGGKVVAGAQCRIVGTDIMLDMMWVDESLRGRDIGSRTLMAAIEAGRAQGCTRAATETLDCQAVGFYRKLGFENYAYAPSPIPGLGLHFLQMRL